MQERIGEPGAESTGLVGDRCARGHERAGVGAVVGAERQSEVDSGPQEEDPTRLAKNTGEARTG